MERAGSHGSWHGPRTPFVLSPMAFSLIATTAASTRTGVEPASVGDGSIGTTADNTYSLWTHSLSRRKTFVWHRQTEVDSGRRSESCALQKDGRKRSWLDAPAYIQLMSAALNAANAILASTIF